MPKGILHIVAFQLILDNLSNRRRPALLAKQIATFY